MVEIQCHGRLMAEPAPGWYRRWGSPASDALVRTKAWFPLGSQTFPWAFGILQSHCQGYVLSRHGCHLP